MTEPRGAETSMEQDLAVFPDPTSARSAYETLRSGFGSAACLGEFDPEVIEHYENGGTTSTTWYLRVPPDRDAQLSETVSLVVRGRAISILAVATNEDIFTWDARWILPTTETVRNQLAAYEQPTRQ